MTKPPTTSDSPNRRRTKTHARKPVPPSILDEIECTYKRVHAAISGSFTITNEDTLEYQTGHYKYLYLNPSKRMTHVLTLEREVLCLIAPYISLQARTINAALDLINASGGRLETSLIIIIHKDRNGNLTLKKWGREKGIGTTRQRFREVVGL